MIESTWNISGICLSNQIFLAADSLHRGALKKILGLRASLGWGQLMDRRMGRTVEQPKNSVELLVDMLQGRVWHDDTNQREPLQKERVEQTGNCESKKLFFKLFFE